MSDIVERLRASHEFNGVEMLETAADTITRLTAEVERLLSVTVVQETLIRKSEAENEKLRAAIECALRQLADGNRVSATGILTSALSGDKHE